MTVLLVLCRFEETWSVQEREIKGGNMGISGKKGNKYTDAWRTNSLLLFFPEDRLTSTSSTLYSSFRRTRGVHLLLTRALSTLSAFALLFLLFFTFHHPSASRHLRRWGSSPEPKGGILVVKSPPPFALQGMGLLHRRGSRAMPDLIVVHVPEDAADDGVRLFLRALHHSGLTARSDVVIIFPHRSSLSNFGRVIREENKAFLRLLDRDRPKGNHTIIQRKTSAGGNVLSFDAAHFDRTSRKDKEAREPLWGKRKRSDPGRLNARWSYGSIVSFESGELDPEGSLSGFLDHVPMSLRRWSCYSILLGRVRRNFKHVMLVDVKNWVVINDPFVRIRNRSAETVILWVGSNPDDGKHRGRGKREFRAETSQPPGWPRLNPGILVGGMRGVRRMTEAMQTGIVRAAMRMQQRGGRRKGGAAVAESGVLSQLVDKELLPKNVDMVVLSSDDDVSATLELTSHDNNNNIRRGNNLLFLRVENNNYGEIRRLICSSVEEEDISEIYSDC